MMMVEPVRSPRTRLRRNEVPDARMRERVGSRLRTWPSSCARTAAASSADRARVMRLESTITRAPGRAKALAIPWRRTLTARAGGSEPSACPPRRGDRRACRGLAPGGLRTGRRVAEEAQDLRLRHRPEPRLGRVRHERGEQAGDLRDAERPPRAGPRDPPPETRARAAPCRPNPPEGAGPGSARRAPRRASRPRIPRGPARRPDRSASAAAPRRRRAGRAGSSPGRRPARRRGSGRRGAGVTG